MQERQNDYKKALQNKLELMALQLAKNKDIYITTSKDGIKIKALNVEIISK